MKILLLFPRKYSFTKSIENSLNNATIQSKVLEFENSLNKFDLRINVQIFRVPDKFRLYWESYYFEKINSWYIDQFEKENAEVVFIYNNQMLLPETMDWLKKRKTKIFFFLGDSPFYTRTSRYNLKILEYADAIFVPDTFWKLQLEKTGLKNVNFILPPLPSDIYYPVNLTNDEIEKYSCDFLYIGMSYIDSWGYKKAKFLNYFSKYNLKIIGNNKWEKWFQFFPELKNHFTLKKNFISDYEMNKMFNNAKMIPVDGNPGILNGIHFRVFEAVAAGVLPIIEWNSDIDLVFPDIKDLPVIKDYNEINKLVEKYINDKNLRIDIVSQMKNIYNQQFDNENFKKKILSFL